MIIMSTGCRQDPVEPRQRCRVHRQDHDKVCDPPAKRLVHLVAQPVVGLRNVPKREVFPFFEKEVRYRTERYRKVG